MNGCFYGPIILLCVAGLVRRLRAHGRKRQRSRPVRDANETFFGTEVRDPYRWLEDVKSPEVKTWMKSQSDYTMSLLARIPGRQAMFERIVKYEEAVPARVVQAPRETGDRWFFERRGATRISSSCCCVRACAEKTACWSIPRRWKSAPASRTRSIITAFARGGPVAYGFSAQGSEAAVLHVLNTQTGKRRRADDRADFAGVNFSPDGRTLFFNRLQPLKAGMPETEKYQKSQVLMMKPGTMLRARYRCSGRRGRRRYRQRIPIAGVRHDGRWALGYVFNGTQREIGLFVAPEASVLEGKPAWRRVFIRATKSPAWRTSTTRCPCPRTGRRRVHACFAST